MAWRLFDLCRDEPGTFSGMFPREDLEVWTITYEKSGAEVGTVFICRVLPGETFERDISPGGGIVEFCL